MYSLFKGIALKLMKAPTQPPEPPLGSEGSAQIYRAAPKFLTYNLLWFFLLSALSYALPLILIIAGFADEEIAAVVIGILLLPLLLVIQICFYFAVRIDYDMRYYIVTDRSLRVREGAFIVKEKTISFANVQNMRVVQGPILRAFGIWHLKVDTAGGGGASEKGKHGSNAHEVQMAGIENAHEVRDLILGHLRRGGASAGLGDLDDRDDDAGGRGMSAAFHAALGELKEATAGLRTVAERRA